MNMRKSVRLREAAEKLYAELTGAGLEVLFDDRQVRPGVMFADAELIGIPHRIVIGDRGSTRAPWSTGIGAMPRASMSRSTRSWIMFGRSCRSSGGCVMIPDRAGTSFGAGSRECERCPTSWSSTTAGTETSRGWRAA